MKKELLFTFIVLMFNYVGFSQTFTTQWQQCMGGTEADGFTSYTLAQGSGYICAGYSSSNNGDVSGNHGSRDAWVVKQNSLGTIEWQKSLGGYFDDVFLSLIKTNDGGYIAAGYTNSYDGDVSGNHGGVSDAWVVKLNSVGAIEWQKCLGGTGEETFRSIIQTPDGGFLAVGYTNSNDGDVSGNHGIVDVWVVKLNSVGSIEWQRNLGGDLIDVGLCVINTPDNGYILSGYTTSTNGDVSINLGYDDAWVVKLTNVGNIEWQKTYGGTSYDEVISIINTIDGGYLMVGYSLSNDSYVMGNHGGSDGWVIKISNIGNIEWQKLYGGTDSDTFTTCTQTASGEFVITGYSSSNDGQLTSNQGMRDIWVLKINDIGIILWQKSFGGSDTDTIAEANGIIPLNYGEYVLAGTTFSNDGGVSGNHGLRDAWLLKFKVTNFNLFPNYPCQDKYERLSSEGCNGTTRWYMYLAGQTPTLISSNPNFNYLVPSNLPVQTPIFFECWCLNILGGQTMMGSGYARVLGVANHNLSSPTDDIIVTPPLPYNVSHKILATNKIGGNSTNVEYRAEESITLLPGFQSDANTVFKAHIGGCNQ